MMWHMYEVIFNFFKFQIEFGDIKTVESSPIGGATVSTLSQTNMAQQLSTITERFYPRKYREMSEEGQRYFIYLCYRSKII